MTPDSRVNIRLALRIYITRTFQYRLIYPVSLLTETRSNYSLRDFLLRTNTLKIRVRLTIRSLPHTRIYIYKYSRRYINTFSRQRFNRSLQRQSRWQTWAIHIHRRSVF